jgi:Flp pilus assembly CpaE family ATPase
MVQEGAQDYIIKSACNRDVLSKALRYAAVRQSGQPGSGASGAPANTARVIGVMGAKGGVGASTVACNLAAELRRQTNQKTLVADLDMEAGLVSFLTSAESQYSIVSAIFIVWTAPAGVRS